mgnify:CR=1 FL=1
MAFRNVAAYRKEVGNEVDLCLEFHRRMTPSEAIVLINELAQFRPYFCEDPTKPDNFESMEYIAGKVTVPIATGERLHTPQEFQQLISRRAVDYVRPDVCMCGGITGAKKIAAIAEANDILVVPHNPLSPVSTSACLQIAASIPNFGLLEYPGDDRVSCTDRYISNIFDDTGFRQGEIVKKQYVYENGYIKVPTSAPGLGIELVENAETIFPYQRRVMATRLHVDGSVVDQ